MGFFDAYRYFLSIFGFFGWIYVGAIVVSLISFIVLLINKERAWVIPAIFVIAIMVSIPQFFSRVIFSVNDMRTLYKRGEISKEDVEKFLSYTMEKQKSDERDRVARLKEQELIQKKEEEEARKQKELGDEFDNIVKSYEKNSRH